MSEIITIAPDVAETPDALAVLAARIDTAESRSATAEAQYRRSEHRFRILSGTLLGALVVVVSVPFIVPAAAQGYAVTLQQLAVKVAALETKTASISVLTDANTNQPTVRFSGVNVQVIANGISGRGNLIIGGNNPFDPNSNFLAQRTGNHNLIIGDAQSYTGNSNLIAGFNNTVTGTYASASGGANSNVTANFASVSGGTGNVASGQFSSVSGGISNNAAGDASAISGGESGSATGAVSSISGGVTTFVGNPNSWGVSTNTGSGGTFVGRIFSLPN
jgi:hypothetical protein